MRRILLAPSVAFALAVLAMAPSRANTPVPVNPGLDLLETDPDTTYQDLNLPPGTFQPFCDGGFNGRVYFRGEPIDCFGTVCGLSPTDTIVRRLNPGNPPSQVVQIEIVALELRSVQPITVSCSGGPEDWNVSASVPEGDPNQSPGQMQIQHNHPHGGTFTSSLPVRPMITFTRVSDNATIGPTLIAPIVFNVSAPQDWCHRGNPLDSPTGDAVLQYDPSTNFYPGIICPTSPLGAGQRRKVLTVEQAAFAAHGIQPAERRHHHKCFRIAGPPVNQLVTLRDQFQVQNVQVLEPRYVCPPAIKNNHFGSFTSPHLKCYNIFGFDPPAVVDLNSQFGPEWNMNIGQARMYCTPASKDVLFPQPIPAPNPIPPASPRYTCYDITGPDSPAVVDLLTQFGLEPLVPIGQPRFLCLPTMKNGQGNLQDPHLKCYNIPGADPPHIINLRTQFGLEQNLQVGMADLLCIPATKRPPQVTHVIAPTKIVFNWDPVPIPGVQYNVYRDIVRQFTSKPTCLAPSLPGPSVGDSNVPIPGGVFYYNMTAAIPFYDGPVEGTPGFTSAGAPRNHSNPCVP